MRTEKKPPDFGEALTRAASRIHEAIGRAREQGLGDQTQAVVEGLESAQKIVREEYDRAWDKCHE